jgi:putative FmdB family regulatory protein
VPIYDVKCPECGHTWEVLKKYGEAVACPECTTVTSDTLLSRVRGIHGFAKQPYDYLRSGPPSPVAKSFGNDRRKKR